MIRGDWIKPGAAVIDVGINRTDAGLRRRRRGRRGGGGRRLAHPGPGGRRPDDHRLPARRTPSTPPADGPATRHPNGGDDRMKIAIFGGTGDLGRGLAINFAAAGHEIVVGSRSQERADQARRGPGRGAARGHLHAARERRRRRGGRAGDRVDPLGGRRGDHPADGRRPRRQGRDLGGERSQVRQERRDRRAGRCPPGSCGRAHPGPGARGEGGRRLQQPAGRGAPGAAPPGRRRPRVRQEPGGPRGRHRAHRRDPRARGRSTPARWPTPSSSRA